MHHTRGLSPEEKDETRRRAMANFARALPHEERKARKQRAKERRATRVDRGRPRGRLDQEADWDDLSDFEAMGARAPRRPEPTSGEGGRRGASKPGDQPARRGLVVGLARDGALVELGERRLRLAPDREAELAVGDEVEVEEPVAGVLRLVRRLERRSVLARADPARPGTERVLAANVDLALVVLSVASPPFKPGLFDRFQVALAAGGVEPVLVVNKLDLLEEDGRADLERALAPRVAAGVEVFRLSTHTGLGVADLRERVAGRTLVAVGHSGVGKSSLLNALDPRGSRRAVGAVRASDGKGRHTTTSSDLRRLEGGTVLIDTPGIRSLGLSAEQLASVDEAFPDIAELALACRFSDCRHADEPDCAVRSAREDKRLAPDRWDAYRRLRDG